MQEIYYEMDKKTPNGTFTVPSTKKYDIKGMREYCKQNKIKYTKLKPNEIEKFQK